MACRYEAGCKLLSGEIDFGDAALRIVRMRFCDGDWQKCARFVFRNVAFEEAPSDLLPADNARLDEFLPV